MHNAAPELMAMGQKVLLEASSFLGLGQRLQKIPALTPLYRMKRL